jgi:hypothetical protein
MTTQIVLSPNLAPKIRRLIGFLNFSLNDAAAYIYRQFWGIKRLNLQVGSLQGAREWGRQRPLRTIFLQQG